MTSFFFIFSKFKKLKSKRGFLSFNFYLSVFLIAISLSAIIITDSLTDGYKKEIFSKLSSLNPDFTINKKYTHFFTSSDYLKLKNELSNFKNIIYSPYFEKSGILLSESKISDDIKYKQREGIYILGLNQELLYSNNLISRYLMHEKSNLSDSDIIIGNHLAKKINKSINDEVYILIYNIEIKEFEAKKYIINNIYETNTQNDEFLIYSDLKTLKNNNDSIHSGGIVGYYLDNKNNSIEISDKSIIISDWDTSNLLQFLNTFDTPIKLLMWILLFLSTYSLSLLVYNFINIKNKDIKLLYILGYSFSSMRKIMILINLYVSFISILIGLSFSFLFITLQNKFQLISLPSEKIFQLSYIPAHVDIIYFIKYPIFILLFTITISVYFFNKLSTVKFK